MLERMWRKRNPPTLLVGMEIGATTVENGIEFLKKQKIELPYDPEIPLLGILSRKKILFRKYTCTPMFTATLFTKAKTQKQ